MKIIIETIPHSEQRYPTCGDWFIKDEVLFIKVSQEVGDWKSQAAVALHELAEVFMCQHKGIAQFQVDEFDMKFEEERKAGLHSKSDEPGDSSKAPYYKQHQIASGIERIIAAELGIDWNTYTKAIEELP